jgi:hypothetical protein
MQKKFNSILAVCLVLLTFDACKKDNHAPDDLFAPMNVLNDKSGRAAANPILWAKTIF